METTLMTSKYLIEVVKDTIESVKYCFLITINESKQAHARLVEHFNFEADMTLWFVTNAKSRKVREILNKNSVTVTFQDDSEQAYVTALGIAIVETDSYEKQKRWQEDWIVYFPAGIQSNDYVLIKFVPSRIELMNFARHVASEPLSELQPAILTKVEKTWVLEESKK
ncbi:general stress protein [Chroococcidiopsis cubana SAG 39.79]|jgi:general stress protein 26|uniref:General stress protein n=2 Tax=Chroococcidiopsis TaxID=54298 RepID=A0AB37UTB4_9CYAN|nr:pyridoxamine 5'-phosphate oxidase family protein [Chroococcidiopsis sp. CCNUC1]RUT14382.1 general stress protein [Chroococcidiopsis cubana SAG 39.79]URD50156.1 pyridoxamine 5'-phosphate oxidase family protein [Chroococcidiopsis sp. CCNUC1]